jgi:arylsulfatase A-like enzyme
MRRRSPLVPRPEKVPLPAEEPVPATPFGPNPQHGDLPYRAGDLYIGAVAYIRENERPKKVKRPFPFGFQAPAEQQPRARAGTPAAEKRPAPRRSRRV